MGFIIFIVMGGVIGWLASIVMKRDASMGIGLNIVVGVVGSMIGNGVFSLFGGGSIGDITDIGAMVAAFIGAVVLLGGLNLLQRGNIRG
jgi:uncharacterized membrane protein YeaQ/YmgE (transglycosylase-associated protein family)